MTTGNEMGVTRKAAIAVLCLASTALAAASGPAKTFDVRKFGATGDGVTNDSAAFQAAIDAAHKAQGSVVLVPKGKYNVANLVLYSDLTVQGEGDESLLMAKGAPDEQGRANFVFAVNPGTQGTSNPAENAHDITLKDMSLYGGVSNFGYAEHKHLIVLSAVSHVVMDHLLLHGYRGDGIYIASGNGPQVERHNQDILVQNCRFDGVNHQNRNGISIIDGSNVRILGNHFLHSGQDKEPGAIDLEPNANFNVVDHVEVAGNTFDQDRGNGEVLCIFPGHSFTTQMNDIRIHDNTFNATSTKHTVLVLADPTTLNPGRGMGVVISNNTFNAANVPINLIRAQGVEIMNNRFNRTLGIQIGIPGSAGATWRGVTLSGNTFSEGADSVACVRLAAGDGIKIRGNTFDAPMKSGAAVSVDAPQSIGDLEVTDNTFNPGPQQQYTIRFQSSSAKKPSWKVWGNKGGGVVRGLRSDL